MYRIQIILCTLPNRPSYLVVFGLAEEVILFCTNAPSSEGENAHSHKHGAECRCARSVLMWQRIVSGYEPWATVLPLFLKTKQRQCSSPLNQRRCPLLFCPPVTANLCLSYHLKALPPCPATPASKTKDSPVTHPPVPCPRAQASPERLALTSSVRAQRRYGGGVTVGEGSVGRRCRASSNVLGRHRGGS